MSAALENKIPEQLENASGGKKEWKHDKEKKTSKRMRLEACRNAFHYLELKEPKRAPSTGTCNCLDKSE